MYKISKEFTFSASHKLDGLPESHPCSRLHGHNYKISFEFQSKELNNIGFIIDYRTLEDIKEWINEKMDHRHLNDVIDVNPTAENIAKYCFIKWVDGYPALTAVIVKETEKTEAEYRF